MENERLPKLSIGLAVYNGDRYLEQAIEGLLGQTFADFELIISDNASTDKTREICETYAARDPRIRYVRNEQNIGAAPNFNNLYHEARGEYFKWAAHDDLIEPDFLERCVAVLDEDPTILLAYSKSTKIDETGQVAGAYDYPMRVDSPYPHIRFGDLILINHFCIAIFGVMRREALRGTPLIGSFVGSDRTLLAELGLRGRLYEIPDYLFHRRDHPQTSGRMHKIYDRLAWFDPRKVRSLHLPYWHVGKEYLRAVLRTPLPIAEKIRCLGVVLHWFIRRRKSLTEDLKAVILQVFPFSRNLSATWKEFFGKKKRGGLL